MKSIELTQGYFAVVDDDNYDLLSLFSWHALPRPSSPTYAASSHVKGIKKILMHRLIMREAIKLSPDLVVDHIDRNGLNNTKVNLRLVTVAQNNNNRSTQKNNRSGHTGVCFCKRTNKWKVTFRGQGRGYFKNYDAAVVHRKAIELEEGVF